ncbi:hypothetical protein BZA05DRAFT_418433 [Tricharina praecox]|uniref:uncharacterized protein n=1 Tax=Tricharina praecox TaxID=43433 RepID=UPI00221EB93F|nr:uncharacterized protein BZA05DRAFT_422929 [Tricharina praecox]XP_051339601.1 uncharacterized protein BZA05DRAFT_418433 [Tricharina praecox]KAI5841244.1 hypothetical protein BZA05DRAFT_422929 [Tricharina praecox]KAI5852111.1 hypothetical protein BZA05DRAFT_418433 [Tricharina praecox]
MDGQQMFAASSAPAQSASTDPAQSTSSAPAQSASTTPAQSASSAPAQSASSAPDSAYFHRPDYVNFLRPLSLLPSVRLRLPPPARLSLAPPLRPLCLRTLPRQSPMPMAYAQVPTCCTHRTPTALEAMQIYWGCTCSISTHKKYISAPDVLWTDIEKDFNRVAKIDANVGLYKLNAIRRADFDSAAAYHSRILEIATELRNVGTELPEKVLASYMVQGLPTGDVWLAFRTSLNSSESAGSCQEILDQILERSYAWDRHGVSAYTNTELSTALFAKKGTAKKKGTFWEALNTGANPFHTTVPFWYGQGSATMLDAEMEERRMGAGY